MLRLAWCSQKRFTSATFNWFSSQVHADQLGHHRAHVAEDLAAFLHEQLVRRADALFRRTVEEAEVVADVVGELGQQLGAHHIELVLGRCQVGTFQDHRGSGVTER